MGVSTIAEVIWEGGGASVEVGCADVWYEMRGIDCTKEESEMCGARREAWEERRGIEVLFAVRRGMESVEGRRGIDVAKEVGTL